MLTPVDEIKQRLDIVELINEYVPVKAAGILVFRPAKLGGRHVATVPIDSAA